MLLLGWQALLSQGAMSDYSVFTITEEEVCSTFYYNPVASLSHASFYSLMRYFRKEEKEEKKMEAKKQERGKVCLFGTHIHGLNDLSSVANFR